MAHHIQNYFKQYIAIVKKKCENGQRVNKAHNNNNKNVWPVGLTRAVSGAHVLKFTV